VKTITARLPRDVPTMRLANGDEIPFFSGAFVQTRLEEAGAILMALPTGARDRPSVKLTWWPLARLTFSDAIGREFKPRVRWAAPSADAIDRMDEALTWLPLIGEIAKRRVAAARLLTHPLTGKPIYSYGRISETTGLHRSTVQRWWEDGCGEIAERLTREAQRA
jgi:hypothetical protein